MTVHLNDPLTGRDDELAAIRRALSAAGKYAGVVMVGAAGVGKTRLAREVMSHAEASGERTDWIVGTNRRGHFRWAPSRICFPIRRPMRFRTCGGSSIPLSLSGNGAGQ